ncbi:apoptosis facilitator Bcl-2-like protein 14 [Salminus brasiliensis]|uniref:apoptosis facilitator Bcl-2-like protein 14 n=1 Tax=Salminus brasiliensis TaxID=930266 RepID=UPI003B833CCD
MANETVDMQQTRVEATDSLEYKLLQIYTEKKEPTYSGPQQSNKTGEKKAASPVPSDERHKAKKKIRRIIALISCIRPQAEDNSPVSEGHRCRPSSGGVAPHSNVGPIVSRLSKIADSVHFLPSDLETDGDDIIERIVDILREQGDKLDEEIRNNHKLMQQLQDVLTYNTFQKLTTLFIRRLTPEEVAPAKHPKQAHIALVCELTSRLKTMDRHPMNRVLGFGAKYLQDYYTPWVNQQGGYEKVFSTDDEEEEVE